MRYVVIMAGGAGTRLWPLSRQGAPKQLLSLIDGKSLLRISYERLSGLVPDDRIVVCTGAAYASDVAGELPELPAENILGEPVGRDSINAVAWSAAVLHERDPEAVMGVVTADHLITPEVDFRAALESGFRVAEGDPSALVTFGVEPTSPHTGFGYLHMGERQAGAEEFYAVREFKEKPDADTAEAYLASGEYLWNSGMFAWRASTILRQLELLLPQTHADVMDVAAHPEKLADIYPTLHKTSIDFGVMEPVSCGAAEAHVVAVPLRVSWRDVGGFASLAEVLVHDENGNCGEGLVSQLDGQRNLVINRGEPGHVVATLGLEDVIVVHTPEITMVCPRSESERIKQLVQHTKDGLGGQYA